MPRDLRYRDRSELPPSSYVLETRRRASNPTTRQTERSSPFSTSTSSFSSSLASSRRLRRPGRVESDAVERDRDDEYLSADAATRLMLEKWDRLDDLDQLEERLPLSNEPPTRYGRGRSRAPNRANSVPTGGTGQDPGPGHDPQRKRSRVREWERWKPEMERIRLAQVEMEKRLDDEAREHQEASIRLGEDRDDEDDDRRERERPVIPGKVRIYERKCTPRPSRSATAVETDSSFSSLSPPVVARFRRIVDSFPTTRAERRPDAIKIGSFASAPASASALVLVRAETLSLESEETSASVPLASFVTHRQAHESLRSSTATRFDRFDDRTALSTLVVDRRSKVSIPSASTFRLASHSS
ncbi:hypothetical protein JCM10212_006160 [Sporobolomyces blumeae]